jgi:membrane protease subunit (stomatin/prohibitin family)
MMLRRRRPLLRAAMIGGVGYAGYQAGKHVDAGLAHESEQDEQLARMQQQGDASPAPAEPAAGTDRYETLSKLKELLDSGALTQEEFDSEKQQVLRGR